MSPSPRPFIRTTAGRLAVAGVAALASVSAVAPAAFADDTDLAPESTGPTPSQAPDDQEQIQTPIPTPSAQDQTGPQGGSTAEQQIPSPASTTPSSTESTSPEVEDGQHAAADVAALDDEVEYGPQTVTVTFSRVAGAFYPPTDSGTTFVHSSVTIWRDQTVLRSTGCSAELGLSDTDPETVVCQPDDPSALQLLPGERAEVYVYRYGNQASISIQPCEASECSTSPVPAAFTIDGPAPEASSYSSYRVFPGEPVTQDLLADDWVGDPATTVSIVSGPESGTATLGSDGRTVTYTSAEDFEGTDTITYELTNTNGTSTGTWTIEVVDPMAPNFGSQKYRVGVQVASGAYVPDGTTTVGSTFEIVTTSGDGVTTTQTCTTVPPANLDGSSFCPATNPFGSRDLSAGDRAVITQTKAPEGLLPDPDPVVIEPCDLDVGSCPTVTALFESPGSILPETTPDTATAEQGGEPIVIDVLANDTSEDPNTDLEVTPLPPEQGTIEVIGEAAPPVSETPGDVGILAVPSAGSLALRYTPPANFSGEVPVEYTVTNSNGSTSGTLTITVRPAAEVPTDPEIPTLPTDPEGPVNPPTPPAIDVAPAAVEDSTTAPARVGAGSSMPNTGGPAGSLLGIGFVLAAAGAGILGRRRSTATRGH